MTATRHYATVCRAAQLPVLAASMEAHCRPFQLHTLAWDWAWPDAAGAAPFKLTTRAQFLARHPQYAPERLPGRPRSPVDLVATVRWQFFCDVMEETRQPLTTLDGDLWFWSSPQPMFDEIGARPFAVSPHRIPPASARLPGVKLETHRQYGLFNSGLVYFADLAPAREMAACTLEWSYTEVIPLPDGRFQFGDQGHLERAAERFGAHVIRHPGVNVGPWNVHCHRLALRDGVMHADGRPLIVYHYSSLRLGAGGAVEQLANADYAVTPEQARAVYAPYITALRAP